jgi:hypothetical protein
MDRMKFSFGGVLMKRLLVFYLLVLSFASLAPAALAKNEVSGIGLMIGDTTGFTFKSYIKKNLAFDVAVGLASGYGVFPGFSTQADVMWTKEMVKVEAGALLFYFGGGAFWAQNTTTNVETGIRGLTGAEYFFHKSKWAAFAELAPTFTATYRPGVYLHGAIGARYYF